jgi:hypothetical protein
MRTTEKRRTRNRQWRRLRKKKTTHTFKWKKRINSFMENRALREGDWENCEKWRNSRSDKTKKKKKIFLTQFLISKHQYNLPEKHIMIQVQSIIFEVAECRRSQWPRGPSRSSIVIVGSNPTQGIDVCVRLFCSYALFCTGSGLAMGWSPVQGVLPTV